MKELLLYAVAAAVYVTLGVFIPEFLITWPVGAGFLLLVVCGLPALVRRLD
ncbi:MAG TPA: hypothetical protein VHF67_09895 [Gaiellaceae bacterium]|jgi:hypothetical protein|nr:hypothetical protein [Gaiellaceae bacterium]